MPLSTTAISWLVLVAVAASAAAIVTALAALITARRARSRLTTGSSARRPRKPPSQPANDAGPLAPDAVTAELSRLGAAVATSLWHLAVVRYDAFGDMGGHLSWSMALLDDAGDGVVLTSIHGRSDSRTYAKNISAWTAGSQLSPEEEEAIGFARPQD